MCTHCHNPLDTHARGLLCSACWFAYVCAIIGQEALEKARLSMRVLSHDAERVEQLSLFAEGSLL